MIRFSVIIPNYNHAPFLKQRIDSVLVQTYPHVELIILDDASTDQSREIIETYRNHPRLRAIYYSEYNTGNPFIQWKKGIQSALNEWVWIAESDDYADPLFLENCALAIQQYQLLIVCTQSHWVNEEGSKWFVRKTGFEQEGLQEGTEVIKKFLVHENVIKNASAVVFNKSGLKEHELENLSAFKWCGDWYLWTCLLEKGNLYFIDQPLNYFRRHPSASSHDYYERGFLYREGLPISLDHQRKMKLPFRERWKAFLIWTGHLAAQYRSGKTKGAGVFVFRPLYYCILMHLFLPLLWIKQGMKKKS